MKLTLLSLLFAGTSLTTFAQRTETLLKDGWFFHSGDIENAKNSDFIAIK